MNLRVLIVEDSEDDTLLMLRKLKKEGYVTEFSRVETAEEMKKELQEKEWDLIISDHDMPIFSAPEALQVYSEAGPDIPFIILSGTICEELAVSAMKGGAHDYIRKDNMSRLIPALQRELREAEIRRERRKEQAALRQREEEFRALVENSPDVIVRFDHHLKHLYVNPAVEKVLHISRDEFKSKTNRELRLSSDKQDVLEAAVRKVLATGREEESCFSWFTPAGRKYYHSRVVPEFAGDGTVQTVLAVIRDITEVKKLEQKLFHEKQNMQRIHLKSVSRELPRVSGLNMAAHYQAGPEVRGDGFNVIRKDNYLIIYLSDVAENNPDGVMQSMYIRNFIDEYFSAPGSEVVGWSPGEIIRRLERNYYQENNRDHNAICILLGIIDLHKRVFTFALNNFMVPPLLFSDASRDVKNRQDKQHKQHKQEKEYDNEHNERGSCRNTAAYSGYEPAGPDLINEKSCFTVENFVNCADYTCSLSRGATLFMATDGFWGGAASDQHNIGLLTELFSSHNRLPPEILRKMINEDKGIYSNAISAEDDHVYIILQAADEVNYLNLELRSDFSDIEDTIEQIVKFLLGRGIKTDGLLELQELLVNAIEHGNKFDGARRVFVEVMVMDNHYRIKIKDQGEGFNWREKINKEIDPEDYSERGRGIIMSRLLCACLQYNEKGNEATIIKLREPGQG